MSEVLKDPSESELWGWSVVALVVKEASGRYGLTLYATVRWVESSHAFEMRFICPEVGMKFSALVHPEHILLYKSDAAKERARGLCLSFLSEIARARDERR